MFALAVLAFLAVPQVGAGSQPEAGYRVHMKAGTFEDVRDDLHNAVLDRGFVIDFVGHFNDMLGRTANVAGQDGGAAPSSPYVHAEYFHFCPAKLTHEAVGASPRAIANCPLTMFIYELAAKPGQITVGYRLPVATPNPALQAVDAKLGKLLEDIAADATK
ncbi:MAG: DUF302 domain-containing protein [Hyphomicrobiaceae bacterium]